MQSQDEWHFELAVTAPALISRALIDALLNEAIDWAEARRLGIGGGYRPTTPEVGKAAMAWRFDFGLCVQADGCLIPEPQAAELLEVLRGWCGPQGLSVAGGFRAFSPKENE